MAKDLEAGSVTLLQLFKGEREYVSPLFQRRYVWGKVEIEKLFEDIDEILDGKESSRFLGAIVLEIKTAGLAFQPDSSWIVDGQQRLTSLYMLLLRLAFEADRGGDAELAGSLARQYLFNQDGQYKNQPKVAATLLDTAEFNSLFRGFTATPVKLQPDFGPQDGDLAKAAKRVEREVRARCVSAGTFDPVKTKQLVTTVLERLKFVQIVLGDDMDPHQVFDSLNAKGVRLENKDLIRNIVFQKLANKPEQAQLLYLSQWIPLEQELGIRFDGYFFPFGLIHRPTVTKSTLLSTLRERWKDMPPAEIIRDLRVFVRPYNVLTDSAQDLENFTDDEGVAELLQRFSRMGVPTSTYPFLLILLKEFSAGALDREVVRRNLIQLEAFLVRRSLAGFEPTGLHAVFKDLWAKTQGDPVKFVTAIDETATVQFPEDDEFANDIRTQPLFGRRLAMYILMEYERGLRGGDPLPSDISPTIDHVLPQELTEAWRQVLSAEEHARVKDLWANLVPLSLPANAEKGRKPWPDVRAFFQTETMFKTTKRLASENETWTSSEIDARSKSLVSWALPRWPKRA